jgi:hypothetical protein
MWVFGVVDGEHSGGCAGGLGEWGTLIKDGDSCSAMVEFEGERKADDASSSDTDIRTWCRGMHKNKSSWICERI